jgi:hypothetical protein
MRAKLDTNDSYGRGLSDEDIERIASRETQIWMNSDSPWTSDTESLEVIVASGLISLERYLASLSEMLRTVGADLRRELARRARFEARLFELDARDAILIRNALAEEFEIQPLSHDMVRERHPFAFGDVQRGALDTRLSRLRKGTKPRILRRNETSFIDILREIGQLPQLTKDEGT